MSSSSSKDAINDGNKPESSPLDTSSVTMVDVLNEQAELEAETDAVLGGSDEKNCTYSEGYIGRQALYSCLTCNPESRTLADKRAGVCLACSYHCHEGHELIELYTKRNFRCDCGASRMPNVTCKLDPIKLSENDKNYYNQNFSGLYCTCRRPYPDPEDNIPDEMIQCIVCEDWYHTRHLDTDIPANTKDFAEMICGGCMERVNVLQHYVGNLNTASLDDTVQVDVTGLDQSNVADTSTATCVPEATSDKEEEKDIDNPAKRVKLDICTKPPIDDQNISYYKKGATFWNDGWRTHLCRCTACMELYRISEIEFLLDEKDTVQWYEENGRAKREARGSSYEQGMEMLNRIGRVQQVEVLTEFNRMKERLREFLDSFVTSQQVVTENDVREFFANLKREKASNVGTPTHFCR